MNRRKFLIAGGLGLAVNLCNIARLSPLLPPNLPTHSFEPTLTPLRLATADGGTAVSGSTAQTAQVTAPAPSATAPARPTPQLAGDLVDDALDGPADAAGAAARVTGADSAGEVSFARGVLQISGKAPADGDPWIYASRRVPCADGQALGARFKVAYGRESGRIGLSAEGGQPLACLRRTAAEGAGGIIECGEQAYPVLDLYSGCWYDFLAFFQSDVSAGVASSDASSAVAFAINDGAGAELVLVGENHLPGGYLGCRALAGQDQEASLDAWYALGPLAFPPVLLAEANPPAGYEADAGTNAAWVEARVRLTGGQAGLRIRSVDRDNEYRVSLEGTQLKVEQVIDGVVTPVAKQEVTVVDGAVLAARYNELTLTVYYNGQATRVVNQKIGAGALIGGTKVGLFSSDPRSTFAALTARAVNLAVPAPLAGRLLDTRRVLCLGDSLTSADKAFGYQNRLRKRLGDAWVTVDGGVPGQTTWQMLARLPSHLRRYRPRVIVVLGGTNDLDNHHRAAEIQANLQAIYTTARKAGARVASVTIPPCRSSQTWTDEKQAAQRAVNDWILGRAGSPAHVDDCIDAYALLEEPGSGCLQARYDGGDHMHLSAAGYNALAEAILRAVKW